ncbi:S24 family peptidase [Lactiplantibacillus argentoratensis]|jgi:Predicted transcriptional regulator|uniref:S24 family peptidase n=1 Tax=Lactobacillaceae TaxID=33958 RepID=UPI000AC31A9F|nr:S24 family peptidase [Companilactobacillus farciminis]WCG36872.1 S24 family peptidase [Companilactobacillus farciminis]
MIAVKKYKSLQELCDGDIVIFQDGGDMSVKRYYNSPKNRTITFNPDSSDTRFYPITYRYEDLDDIRILGKVVVYTVNLR